MKFRKDFVTNSSSSSYTCDICGATESGWDISLEEAGMVECVNGHTICNDELLEIPRKELIKKILESGYENESEEELNSQHDNDSLLDIFWDQADNRYAAPEEFCPICQFIEYSQHDLGKYLEKEYKVSHDHEGFACVNLQQPYGTHHRRHRKRQDDENLHQVLELGEIIKNGKHSGQHKQRRKRERCEANKEASAHGCKETRVGEQLFEPARGKPVGQNRCAPARRKGVDHGRSDRHPWQ